MSAGLCAVAPFTEFHGKRTHLAFRKMNEYEKKNTGERSAKHLRRKGEGIRSDDHEAVKENPTTVHPRGCLRLLCRAAVQAGG